MPAADQVWRQLILILWKDGFWLKPSFSKALPSFAPAGQWGKGREYSMEVTEASPCTRRCAPAAPTLLREAHPTGRRALRELSCGSRAGPLAYRPPRADPHPRGPRPLPETRTASGTPIPRARQALCSDTGAAFSPLPGPGTARDVPRAGSALAQPLCPLRSYRHGQSGSSQSPLQTWATLASCHSSTQPASGPKSWNQKALWLGRRVSGTLPKSHECLALA